MKSIKTGDKVKIIAGKDRGKEGIISKVLGDKVIVEGANIVKKHLKPKTNGGTGEIVERENPIHVSNVKVLGTSTPKKETKKEPKKKATKEVVKKETKPKKAAKAEK